MTSVLKRDTRGKVGQTKGRHCDRGGRAWREAAASQGMLAASRSWRRPGRTLPLGLQTGSGPTNTLILDFLPPELYKNKFLLFEATQL